MILYSTTPLYSLQIKDKLSNFRRPTLHFSILSHSADVTDRPLSHIPTTFSPLQLAGRPGLLRPHPSSPAGSPRLLQAVKGGRAEPGLARQKPEILMGKPDYGAFCNSFCRITRSRTSTWRSTSQRSTWTSPRCWTQRVRG